MYTQEDNGRFGGTLTLVEQTATVYNALDKATTVTVTDESPQGGQTVTSVQTTAQYDDLGRITQLADPDRGTHNYTYDANGNLIGDVSGSNPTRTIGYAYDLLDRLGCVQDEPSQFSTSGACGTSANGGSYNAYVQNTYDANKLTISGTTDYPVGQPTQSVSTTYFSGSAASVTESFEHDARGRSIGEQVQFSLPSSWNVTTALPSYLQQSSYNDTDQLTTTQTSTNPSGQGFTTTLAYDSTGALYGLSNNSSSSPDLATLTYNARAQLNAISFQTNSGGVLAAEQLLYDANLRTTSETAIWGANSGQSGTIFSQALSYDPASNVISLSATQDAVGSSAGGSETSNFCYNEQNRLVWAGNSGTQPGAGNGTCGSATLSSGLAGASYNDSYLYTHLGELWQGPLSGGGTQVQYLYCASNTHQLIGLYPTSSGATCSNYTSKTASYSSRYDQWGNVTNRTANSTTGTLTYDILDHLTQWYANSTNQEQYLYDASGERMLRRFTNSNSTTILTYPFGIEEHQYSGSGSSQWNIYYYFLSGRLLGSLDGNGTQFYLVDALGSIVSAFNTSQGGASMKSNQLFGPYGNARYYACCLNTAKGFLGQYNDGTGLDYFNARYYDPVGGMFLSVDTVQGNTQGMNPYAYVNGNPETQSDPNGHMRMLAGSGVGGTGYITPASTAITIPSLFYGGLTSFASTKIAILRAYMADPKYTDPWIRTYVKNETGISNVAKRVASATSEADALEGSARTLSHFGNILLGIGALLDGAISGMDYYNQHPDQGVAGAIGVGVTHAALSTTGAYIGAIAGADFGAAVGTLLLPGVGTVVGAWVGGALGGALGGWAGDQLANSWSQAASAVGNWFGSLF